MEEKYKIHAFYILSILLVIIALLVTIKWAEIPGLADYITFALTVLSIGLAIIAIVYSIYSNTSFVSSIRILESSTFKLSSTSETLSSTTQDLSNKVDLIPNIMKGVEDKVTKTHSLVEVALRHTGEEEKIIINQEEISDDFICKYCKGISFNGLIVYYLAFLSKKYSKTYSFLDKELLSIVNMTEDYALAFDIAGEAIGLYKLNDADEKNLCIEMNSYLYENIVELLQEKINAVFPNFEEARVGCNKTIKKAEEYFIEK